MIFNQALLPMKWNQIYDQARNLPQFRLSSHTPNINDTLNFITKRSPVYYNDNGFKKNIMNIHSLLKVKHDLCKEEALDGEGGFNVWGRLIVANDSLSLGAIPIGLAHGVQLKSDIEEGQIVIWADVNLSEGMKDSKARKIRWKMEANVRPKALEPVYTPAKTTPQKKEKSK